MSPRYWRSLFFALLLSVSVCWPARAEQLPPASERLQAALDTAVAEAARRHKFDAQQLAVTVIDLTEADAVSARVNGTQPFYPASIVKLFYLMATHAQAAGNELTIDEELGRALEDMIIESSNDATGYVIDRLTGTTSGPELPNSELQQWIVKRLAINRYFRARGYENINVCQKTFSNDIFGRDRQFRGEDGKNRNSLTTDAVARLWYEILTAKDIAPERRSHMLSLLERDHTRASKDAHDEATAFIKGLPATARLWSKSGWTSEVRHTSAYIELPQGARFILTIFTKDLSDKKELLPAIARSIVDTMAAQRPQPDTLLINGIIWTDSVARKGVKPTALAIRRGRIIAIGTDRELRALASNKTRVIDLGGRLAVPGFIDSHAHFIRGGAQLLTVSLRDARTPEEFAKRLGEFAARKSAGEWILGGEWDHENWPGAPLPTRQLIDSVTANNPVLINRLDGHMALANSRALQMAGITRETPDPPGGQIVRDAQGEPTGILRDEAMDLVQAKIPPFTEAQYDTALEAALKHAARYGVTTVNDMANWPDYRTYWRALNEGRLSVRINLRTPIMEWRQHLKMKRIEGRGNDWIRLSGLKGYSDGSLGSTTALFFDPYVDSPESTGLMMGELQDGRMRAAVIGADAHGLQVALHAIGDRANRVVLDLYEETARVNGPRDRRLRIEHAQHLTRADIARFGALGVVASMQPYHCIDDGRWAEKRIGAARVRWTYAFRSLLDSNALLAFGSDWSVAPINPLEGIFAAVTRRTLDDKNPGGWVAQEKITVAESLRGYTIGAARASFEERVKGSLTVGKLADIVVLADNIFTIAPHKIFDASVYMTIVDGRVVYSED